MYRDKNRPTVFTQESARSVISSVLSCATQFWQHQFKYLSISQTGGY